MAITTAEDFFAVLERSKLLSPEQLDEARAAGRQGHDPTNVARILVQKDLLSRWQAGQLLAGRGSFFLGKYKLIELLGRGGMGNVFLGQHTMMNRRVALKILSRRVGKEPASLDQFLCEARTVAALDHPNIVHAYSFDNEGDRYYMVMEYVEGPDLRQIVEAEGPLDYRRAADYVRQAADGLAHGHQRHVIHCDVKPSNLLVNDQGVVKIVDMGLARLSGPDEDQANGQNRQDEKLLGSVDYLAPEQALKSSDLDHRADIYSLGCTFYFLLTGHPPFPDGLLHERLMRHQTQEPESILKQRPDAPKELVSLCRKMMAKKPEDRPQSAEQISRTLAAWHPPERKPKRAVPLKVAEALEGPAAGGLPSIDVAGPRKPTPSRPFGGSLEQTTTDGRAKERRAAQKAGLLRTRQQKILAAAVAVLVPLVLLAVATALLMQPASDSGKNHQRHAESTRPRSHRNITADRKSTPSDEPRHRQDALSIDKPPATVLPVVVPESKDPKSKPPEPVHPEPNDVPPEAPESKPPESKPPESKPPESKPPESKPPESNDPKPTDSKPNDLEPKDPKPEKPQGPEKPARPEKKDPFREFVEAVNLPALEGNRAVDGQPGEPLRLAMLHVAPDASWDIELKGGKDDGKRRREFLLGREEEGAAWLIRLRSGSRAAAKPEGSKVARIWLDQQALNFQWLEDALAARGNNLRSCGLSIRVDDRRRWLPFAEPKEVKPLVLSLNHGAARTPLSTEDWMPKHLLRLEITKFDGPLPKPEFKPANRISENRKVEILFRKENLPQVRLQVALGTRGGRSEIGVFAECQLPDQAWYPLTREAARHQAALWSFEYQRLKAITERMEGNDPRRAMVRAERERRKAGAEQIEALLGALKEIRTVATIHFRVFTAADDQKVVLFTTQPPAPEARHDEEPRPKDNKSAGGRPGDRERR